MSETILFVDDEQNILHALQRVFVDSNLQILTTSNPLQAIDICRSRQVAVVVSDNMMPEMRGVELLAELKKVSPQTVKILMTAYADLPTALQAINSGEVYRFIVKPWQEQELVQAISESIARSRILAALERENEAILRSLAQTIELKDLYTRGHCERVADYALTIAGKLDLPEPLSREIRHGSWLHDCGKIGVPETILNSSGKLSDQEFATIRLHPDWGASVAEQASLPVTVVNIIRFHHERYDGNGYPLGLQGEDIPLEARIVAVADVFDALTTDRPYKQAFTFEQARKILTELKGTSLDPCLVELFLTTIDPIAQHEG